MNTYRSTYTRFKALNRQIIACRNRKWALLTAKWVVAVAVIMAIALVAYPTSPTMLPIGLIAAIALPLWGLKPWRFFQSGWTGIVEAHELEESYENVDKKLINPRYNGRHYVTYVHFTARDEKGRIRAFKLERKYEEVYQIGDRVLRIPGLDYPVDLTLQKKTVCPCCGAIFPRENQRCVTVGCKMPHVELDQDNP